MMKKNIIIAVFSLLIVVFVLPFNIKTISVTETNAQIKEDVKTPGTREGVYTPDNSTIGNPIKIKSIQDLIAAILKLVVEIGLPIAVLFLIYAGFLFVTAGGDTTKLDTAKATFLYTVIGLAILLGASLIASIIGGTIKDLGFEPH